MLAPPHCSQDHISIVDVDDISILSLEVSSSNNTHSSSSCSGALFIKEQRALYKVNTIGLGLSSLYVVEIIILLLLILQHITWF